MSESCTNVVIEQHALSPEERAVLKSAERFIRLVDRVLKDGDAGLILELFDSLQFTELKTFVETLRASRQPAGVDPATVAPGTRFKFAVDSPVTYWLRKVDIGTGLIGVPDDPMLSCVQVIDTDRIIHIPEDQ